MDIISVVITLILVMDPFGNIPVFVSLLGGLDPKRRTRVIIRELIIALGLLFFFLFFGRYLLAALNLSQEAIGVAGGVVLLLIALRMIFPEGNHGTGQDKANEEPLIVPLAVPLVAGPSSITYLILTSSSHPEALGVISLGLVIAWIVSTVLLLLSSVLSKILGLRVLGAIERLMGMILITLAVQMLLNGFYNYLNG